MSTRKSAGLVPPNYTQTPNVLFDDFLPVISNAELRVTLVVTRLTMGWHKDRTDVLSVEEIAQLGGLSTNSAKTGIAEGIKRGSIRRIKCRDERNRKTYKYALNISEKVSLDEIERPRKAKEEPATEAAESNLIGQILAGSISGCFKVSTSQNLAASDLYLPVSLSSQNLAGSNKEERNLIDDMKEKREGTSFPALKNPTEDVETFTGEEGTPPDGGAANAADDEKTDPDKEKPNSPSGGDGPDHDKENVPGGGAAAGGPDPEVEAYIRKKLSTKFVDRLLEEVQPLGVDRQKDWFALPLERVKDIFAEAVKTHRQHEVKAPTRVRDLLDQEVQRAGLSLPPDDAPIDPDADPLEALLAGVSLNGRRGGRR